VIDRVVDVRADLESLAELCGDAVLVNSRGSTVTLGIDGGEAIEVEVGDSALQLAFAGWVERLSWTNGEERDEACELARDFVAAALFGELRVIERVHAGRVLRRELEVCVDGSWRAHAKLGALGLAGAVAAARGRLEQRVRSNHGRIRRPAIWRDAGPSGHPRFPWAGATGVVDQAAELAIDGELDLHNFSPKEVGPLVREYIEVCRQRGIRDLRIVHGKGKGVLRRTVHSLLDGHEAVESYRLGGHGEGSWGATIVRLRELR
jgi:hypothetical protein